MEDGEDNNLHILLMAEILHQLRLVVYPIICRVSAPSQVVQDFSHQQYGGQTWLDDVRLGLYYWHYFDGFVFNVVFFVGCRSYRSLET